METGPAIFASVVFLLFGAALLVWTTGRLLHRAPVALGVRPALAVPLTIGAGLLSVALGLWCAARI
ncbi:hypothetical protein ACN20G_13670 [Streptomyces sp. BI20]|uniref:hypothetical protein n=1 Tax=Streptomyces sp. BI20 TaxID=3403460 RepID=UPI003C793AE1